MIAVEEFLGLPASDVGGLVRAAGPQVCVFPINGTRRWFMLENTGGDRLDDVQDYMEQSSYNHIELFQLFFEHGIDTLLIPEFGPDLLLRGDEYVKKIGAAGLERLATNPIFTNFYLEQEVRVHFYGDHRRQLAGTPFAYLSDLFAEVEEKTKSHQKHRLFYGVFANDAADSLVGFSIQYFQKFGHAPGKRALVEGVYGEYIEPVSIFIGFDKPSVFDYPLLSNGEEDLYFTVAPSPYLDANLLRRILYDHLYTRRIPEPDYDSLGVEDGNWISNFYKINRGHAIGLGIVRAGLWFPDPDLGVPQNI
jgi:hypothetical protein